MNKPAVGNKFWSKVYVPSAEECWLWLGPKDTHGYGQMGVNGQKRLAHRLVVELVYGPIPREDGSARRICVLHRCDNPACVNPTHLLLGTQIENIADRTIKGRSNRPAGERNPRAKLTRAQVDAIRVSAERSSLLAKRFNITRHQVWVIRSGKQWGAL